MEFGLFHIFQTKNKFFKNKEVEKEPEKYAHVTYI